MKKTVTIIGTLFVTCAFATDNTREITTSQRYVETQLSNRQDTIPAKSGDKVVTPTSTKGTIGEREVKTTLGDEMTNQADTGITTVETVNTALGNKQGEIKKLPSVNIVTYTGTNDNDVYSAHGYHGAGVVTSTPIYDENVNTYGNGLVRAETLNTAVQRGVSRALTQVPAGFVINKIGDVLPTTVYITATDWPTAEYCFKHIDPTNFVDLQNGCSDTMFNSMSKGDFSMSYNVKTGISYPNDTCVGTYCYKEIRGISACIDQTFNDAEKGVIAPASLSATLQSAYENSKNGATPPGKYCYCRLVEPHIGTNVTTSPWVFFVAWGSPTICARRCARECAVVTRYEHPFRGSIFGGVSAD